MRSNRLSPSAILILVVLGCQEPVPQGPVHASINLTADGTATAVTRAEVEVTAPDLERPLTAVLEVKQGTITGAVTVPAGPARNVVLRAWNRDDIETHNAFATTDLEPGKSVTLTLGLQPVMGEVVIEARTVAPSGTVVAEISAPDMRDPVTVELTPVNETAVATLAAAAGSNRVLQVSRLDEHQIRTHAGVASFSIRARESNVVSVELSGISGDVAIDTDVPQVQISVTPPADTVRSGDTVQLTARVALNGVEVTNGTVDWATSDPGVATVIVTDSRTARVKGVRPGATSVVATYHGRAAAAAMRVLPSSPRFVLVAQALSGALYVAQPPGDSTRLFVVGKPGVIRMLQGGAIRTFLDISSLVLNEGEQGLLSMAFHPDYEQNGYFYVYYTELASGNNRVVRYRAARDRNLAEPGSAYPILTISHPHVGHNGGLVKFGPDGKLYIGTGDGAGPPVNSAQLRTSLLGKLLRIDVNGPAPYGIPTDNPFAGDTSVRQEIWAYGLRNPWRFSFDRVTGDLFIGDVGGNEWEEIDRQGARSAGGQNYGWPILEGTHCFGAATCESAGLTLPLFEYGHTPDAVPTGCAVIGGYVYRGQGIPDLAGHYFYADVCGTWIRSFDVRSGGVGEHRAYVRIDGLPYITSLGEDSNGELYVIGGERVYKMVPGS